MSKLMAAVPVAILFFSGCSSLRTKNELYTRGYERMYDQLNTDEVHDYEMAGALRAVTEKMQEYQRRASRKF